MKNKESRKKLIKGVVGKYVNLKIREKGIKKLLEPIRDHLIEIAKDWGMPVEERQVDVYELTEGIKKGTVTEAFGVGTAATIAQIRSIGLDGVDYNLPKIENEMFQVKINAYLEEYRTGRIEDKFGWRLPIK